MKQLNLFKEKRQIEFGGSLLVGKRRARRPIATKSPTHLVLKATTSFRLLRRRPIVEGVIRKFSERMGIRIFELGIQADHVHLAVRFPSREAYVRWIRALTSVLCQRIPGLKWKLRPYTKIATWGRGFHRLKAYIVHNHKGGELAGGAYAALARALWDVRKIVHESRARPGQ